METKTSIPQDKWGVHRTHCCKKHGCKYGNQDCPVELGLVEQAYGCEQGDYIDGCFEPDGPSDESIDFAITKLKELEGFLLNGDPICYTPSMKGKLLPARKVQLMIEDLEKQKNAN